MQSRPIQIQSVRDADFSADDQAALRSFFGPERVEAIIDDLDRLKAAIYTVDARVQNPSKNFWYNLWDPETDDTGKNEFDRVINVLKSLDQSKVPSEDSHISALKEATSALTKKLELKGAWYALSLAKKLIGTIGEALLYVGIPVSFGVGGAAVGSSLTGNPLGTGIGLAGGVNVGINNTQKWTSSVSNYISSSALFLPSAFRANKAAALDAAVEKAQERILKR